MDSKAGKIIIAASGVVAAGAALWYIWKKFIDVDDEEMRILSNNESKLVLFSDKDICSRLYGILLNLPSWSVKEIVQCCSGFYGFVRQRGECSDDEL